MSIIGNSKVTCLRSPPVILTIPQSYQAFFCLQSLKVCFLHLFPGPLSRFRKPIGCCQVPSLPRTVSILDSQIPHRTPDAPCLFLFVLFRAHASSRKFSACSNCSSTFVRTLLTTEWLLFGICDNMRIESVSSTSLFDSVASLPRDIAPGNDRIYAFIPMLIQVCARYAIVATSVKS